MRRTPSLSALLGITLLVLTVLLPSVPATAAPAATPPRPPAVSWSPCEQNPAAECGTLSVPIDWSRPGGPSIDLALARRKATDPAARIGSLLINPGGPGGSGVDLVTNVPGWPSAELQRRFDIVGFDPRGVGRSHPIVCSADLLSPMQYPIAENAAQFAELRALSTRLRADCRARTGPLFDHVNTRNVVRDLDAIRAAVGDDKLTYYGISYGTLIGQQYAEMFPHRVRALALDGNMDHSLGIGEFYETTAAAAQDAFEAFASWCERSDRCALHDEGVRPVWTRLLARADRGELIDPDQPAVPVTSLELISLAHLLFYLPEWDLLAVIMAALDTGAPLPLPLPTRVPGGGAPGAVANFPIPILCQDFDFNVSSFKEYNAILRRSAKLAPDMRYGPVNVRVTPVCFAQPTPIPNPQERLRVRGSAPLLLGSSLHEPTSPYQWTLGAARQLGKYARVLTYEGWGHGIYGWSDCTTGTIDRYLISRALPPPGARCPAVEPFPALTADRRTPRLAPTPVLPGRPSLF
ncbi:peptidase [Sphaerisporangium siamense]|nr:peptidase [Sphaerisporangium siamense]